MSEAKSARPRLAVAALVLAFGLAACDPAPQAAMPPPGPVEVSVVTVEGRRLPITTELPGRVSALRIAEIRPQVDGIVLERLFREGGEVAAGEALYRIDPKPYEAALASAAAELQRAEASVAAATAKAERYRQLVAVNAVSRQNYDDALAARKQAEADVAAGRAAMAAAQINLDYTVIASPIAGRIGKSAVTEGALVIANQATALAVVQQLDPIHVDLTQSLTELTRLRRDAAAGDLALATSGPARVTLTLDTIGTVYGMAGELLFSDVTVERDTGTVQLRAVFPNPRQELLPGMFVRARVEHGVRDDALLIPQQAVIRGADGSARVWMVDADNRVAPHPIVAERAVADAWLVTDGLKPGDRIVAEGFQKIRPGIEVATVPADVTIAADHPTGRAAAGVSR